MKFLALSLIFTHKQNSAIIQISPKNRIYPQIKFSHNSGISLAIIGI
ncbi:hypothetical protein [Campylobacter lanienae]|nr:hypothetical protein [Campylobacter lanienae]